MRVVVFGSIHVVLVSYLGPLLTRLSLKERTDLPHLIADLKVGTYDSLGDCSFAGNQFFFSAHLLQPKDTNEFYCTEVLDAFFLHRMKKIRGLDWSWPHREEAEMQARSVLENSVGPLLLASFNANAYVWKQLDKERGTDISSSPLLRFWHPSVSLINFD
ncbi:unnamed protein product [Dibothriocephalus latus]|uniref:Uncharacterized protein n=1 Tax=Dibothriocephalus latus TaxID=60516 RepID=A0A3P7LTC4_DIBLA|nr:unnamed protein product [Dibothriocephalus latus]